MTYGHQNSESATNSNMNFYQTYEESAENIYISQQANPPFVQPQYTGPSYDMSNQNPQPVASELTSESLQCEYCQKGFSKQYELTKHLRNHTRPLQCEVCPEGRYGGAAQLKDLYRHYWSTHRLYAKEHNIPQDYESCPDCDYDGRKDHVKRHRRNQHSM